MGDTTARIAAAPQQVFDHLTKPIDDAEPGPLNVGDSFQFQAQGQAMPVIYVLTAIQSPNRLAYTMTAADNSYSLAVEYTIIPDGDGSLVRVEADGRSATSPLFGMLLNAVKESGQEKQLLADLKASMESPTPA